ncbi:hypothetical protein PF008_g11528 [Phytophthora fragariae]|uniref:Uncharacterized protein n=1 Tax=Phytophthora fragariae TaxID=53985 RepID=A0A6G0RQM5_9STRA|nr:hypothetical protein PF008_g11528 [Phytophthora fragariae]
MAEARVLNPDISATTEAFGAYKVSATTQSSGLDDGAAPASLCYERRRREKKKAEKEALKTQVQQYEVQLELLRLRQPIRQVRDTEAKWGGVQAATAEEDKRHKAEELNRQLRGLIAQHLSTAGTFKNLLTQNSDLAERAQSVLNFVFDSSSMFKEDTDSLRSLATAASLKYQDPLGGPCFELLSSTPLACNFTMAVHFLWKMMVGKEVFGPDAACYTMKTQQWTQSSAEMVHSFDLNTPDAPDSRRCDAAAQIRRSEPYCVGMDVYDGARRNPVLRVSKEGLGHKTAL